MIYLDNAATTFPKPESVYEEMDRVNRRLAFNAGRGSYATAREGAVIIEETRRLLVDLVHGIGCEEVAFTTSATEAMNVILQGIKWTSGDIVYISPYEHNAVARVIEVIRKNKNIKVELLPVVEDTKEIDLDKTQYLILKNKPKCVCCTHVSNVTGYILPIERIFSFAHSVGAITVMDGSQSVGLVDFDIKNANADFVVFAGHKTIYGPFGIGGFYDVNNVELNTVFAGGTGSDSLKLDMPIKSPQKYEFGSKNIIAIAGLKAALKTLDISKIFDHERELTKCLIEELTKIKKVKVYVTSSVDNHVGIVSFTINDMSSEDVGTLLDEDYDIAVRTGYHCAPFIHDYLGDKRNEGTVRVGIGQYTTKEDIESFVQAIKELVNG